MSEEVKLISTNRLTKIFIHGYSIFSDGKNF